MRYLTILLLFTGGLYLFQNQAIAGSLYHLLRNEGFQTPRYGASDAMRFILNQKFTTLFFLKNIFHFKLFIFNYLCFVKKKMC